MIGAVIIWLVSGKLETTVNRLRSEKEQLQRDIEEKNRVDEMRREFLSNVSHELKTPLALIQGYAEGLKDNVNDDPESQPRGTLQAAHWEQPALQRTGRCTKGRLGGLASVAC